MKAPAEATAADIFELVWDTLVGVLGTAATATMFRRAVRSAAKRRPELRELQGFAVVRDGMDYRFELPASWSRHCPDCMQALGWLVRDELCPVLGKLTGPVVVDLLARQPELRRCGIVGERGEGR